MAGRRGAGPTLEDELAGLAADAAVNDELEALKARLGNRLPVQAAGETKQG